MRNLKKQHNLSTFFVQSIDIDPGRQTLRVAAPVARRGQKVLLLLRWFAGFVSVLRPWRHLPSVQLAKRNGLKKIFRVCASFGLASTAGLLRASQYLARLFGAGSVGPRLVCASWWPSCGPLAAFVAGGVVLLAPGPWCPCVGLWRACVWRPRRAISWPALCGG